MASPQVQVLLAQASAAQEALLARALTSQGIPNTVVPPYAHLETEVSRAARAQPERLLLVADLAVLGELGTSLAARCEWLGGIRGARLIATCGSQLAVQPQERAWARACGALDLLPGASDIDRSHHLLPVLTALLAALDHGPPDEVALDRALAAPGGRRLAPSPADDACAKLARLAALGVPAPELVAAMQGPDGVKIEERTYHLIRYPECFVGNETVDWMMRYRGLQREAAVEAGGLLLDLGLIYHVAREQPFADGHFFYRFPARLDHIDLATLLQRFRSRTGVAIKDRAYHGVTYPRCFVGAEAVAWLQSGGGLTENQALTLGQRLIDLSLIRHVTNEHPFKDGNFFYRFRADEGRA